MISLFLHSTQSIDIAKNPEGGLVNLQVSDQISYVQSGFNFRWNDPITWKFGPEALRNERKKFLLKFFDNDVMTGKCESIDSKVRLRNTLFYFWEIHLQFHMGQDIQEWDK